MKIYELLYIIGIFLIILSIAIYALSTTLITNPEENSVSTILGKTAEIDSTFSATEALPDVRAMERHVNAMFLWIGIPLGAVIFLTGIFIKRKKEGPDLFIDDEIEDDEEMDLHLF